MTDNTLKPVAWMYEYAVRYQPKLECTKKLSPVFRLSLTRWGNVSDPWTETPLYAHPPAAPDTVTLNRALVEEVLGALNAAIPDGVSIGDRKWPDSLIIPIGTTLGELRLIKSTLTKLTEALK